VIDVKKELVTKEEFYALDAYTTYEGGSDLNRLIQRYFATSHTWENTYKPLKDMGLEKFIKCIISGYKLKFDDTLELNLNTSYDLRKKRVNVKYNVNEDSIKGYSRKIFLEITEGDNYKSACTGLTIEQAKELAGFLNKLIDQLSLLEGDK
jgi:hypothetical protein